MEPATLAELKQKFPNSSAEWREKQLEAGATLIDAAISYATFTEEKAKAAAAEAQKVRDAEKAQHEKDLAAARQAAEDAKTGAGVSLGHAPVVGKGNSRRPATSAVPSANELDDFLETGDPIDDFNSAVAAIAGPNASFKRRQMAIRQVAEKNPELHEAYLIACNPGMRQKRMIQEKLETAKK
jgi:Tfp pilus assembly protein PilW